VPFFSIFEDIKKHYSNLPMYQSGSRGENAIVLIGEDFIVVMSTHDEYDLLVQVLLKWKLKEIIKKMEPQYRPVWRNLLKGKLDTIWFGNAYLTDQDVLYENGVIIYESCLKDVTPQDC